MILTARTFVQNAKSLSLKDWHHLTNKRSQQIKFKIEFHMLSNQLEKITFELIISTC